MCSRWKTDYGAEKRFFCSSDDVAYSRCIGVERDEDGYVSACFLSKNETPVEVQLGFELVNSNSEEGKRTGIEDGF